MLLIDLPPARLSLAVEAYEIEGLKGHAWLSLKSGSLRRAPALAIYRGAREGITYLHFELGASVPVQWQALTCDHPAVHIHTPLPAIPARMVEAVVGWNPLLLSAKDLLVVPFRLHLAGLPEHFFEAVLSWRLQQPLACTPSGVFVRTLTEGRSVREVVQVRNEDPQPIWLTGIESPSSWLRAWMDRPAQWLPPGAEANVHVEISADDPAANGPAHADLRFRFHGRGSQRYGVHVRRIRHPRPLPGPLLIDPGPPRIVLFHLDADSLAPTYLSCSTDRGLRSIGFDLPTDEYARAVYAKTDGVAALAWLVDRARKLARVVDLWHATTVRIIGQPWVPSFERSSVDDAVAWTKLARLSSPPSLAKDIDRFRVDAWNTWRIGANGPAAKINRGLGESLAGGLFRQLFELHQMPGRHADRWLGKLEQALKQPANNIPIALLRLLLAADELLHDYRWPGEFAWRSFHSAWLDAFPATASRGWDSPQVEHCLRAALKEHLALVFSNKTRTSETCLLISPLFACNEMRSWLDSVYNARNSRIVIGVPACWPDWLAWHLSGRPPRADNFVSDFDEQT